MLQTYVNQTGNNKQCPACYRQASQYYHKKITYFLSGTKLIETEFTQLRVFFAVNPSPMKT